jgi:hypothetical protein
VALGGRGPALRNWIFGPPGPPPDPFQEPFEERRWRQREWIRAGIAYLLILAVIGIVFYAGWIFANDVTGAPARSMADLQAFLSAVLTPIIGLVGTVVGFYFGEKAASE